MDHDPCAVRWFSVPSSNGGGAGGDHAWLPDDGSYTQMSSSATNWFVKLMATREYRLHVGTIGYPWTCIG